MRPSTPDRIFLEIAKLLDGHRRAGVPEIEISEALERVTLESRELANGLRQRTQAPY